MSNSINKLRISEKNRIRNIINENKISIERSENSIKTIKNGDIKTRDSSFFGKSIETNKENIRSKTEENELLIDRLSKIDLGELDEDLAGERKTEDNELSKRIKAGKDAKKVKIDLDKAEESKNNTRIQKEYRNDKDYNYQQRIMDNDYRYYCKVCDSIPNYIRENLKTMPNNKGYIFKGVWCYGVLPVKNDRDKDNVIMFEKNMTSNSLMIHTYTPSEYILHEKKGNNFKVLVKREPRVVKVLSNL